MATLTGDVAILDACVLVPMPLCDTLLRMAEADLFSPRWSRDILQETEGVLVREFGLTDTQASWRIAQMQRAFPNALVRRYRQHIPSLTNHVKDRHVLAAAIAAGAPDIVTLNLRDFPASALEPYHIRAISPDEFLLDHFARAPDEITRVLTEQASDLRRSQRTVGNVLERLALQAPRFVAAIRVSIP